jgi:hypothetical protein
LTYTIVDPSKVHCGKTYSALIEDWFNWFLSVDADERNFGPVVFLRASGMPRKPNGSSSNQPNISTTSGAYTDDPFYDTQYPNDPNVRVGSDKLRIRKDQAVLIPIIVSIRVATKPYFDWGYMQDWTGLTIDYGDNPPDPENVTINGTAIKISKDNMRKFRVMTPIFTALVPEADYGRSVKDFLEESFAPGAYPAIVEGYFVLIKDLDPGPYIISSHASAPRERKGPYFAELLYQIDVDNRTQPESKGILPARPARTEFKIRSILKEKQDSGELTADEFNQILRCTKLSENLKPAPVKSASDSSSDPSELTNSKIEQSGAKKE